MKYKASVPILVIATGTLLYSLWQHHIPGVLVSLFLGFVTYLFYSIELRMDEEQKERDQYLKDIREKTKRIKEETK